MKSVLDKTQSTCSKPGLPCLERYGLASCASLSARVDGKGSNATSNEAANVQFVPGFPVAHHSGTERGYARVDHDFFEFLSPKWQAPEIGCRDRNELSFDMPERQTNASSKEDNDSPASSFHQNQSAFFAPVLSTADVLKTAFFGEAMTRGPMLERKRESSKYDYMIMTFPGIVKITIF